MAREVVVMLDAGQDDPMTLEREILGAAGYELHATQCPDVASLLAAAQGAAGLMMWPQIWLPRISSEVIGALDGCRAIVTYSVGFDHIDLAAAKARGIGVSNTPDWCVDEVANHVMALLLAANKKLALNDRTLRAGRWDHRVLRPLHRITGQTLGLVGVGRIGAAVAARAQPFGLRVVGFDPFVPAERVAALGAEPLASLDALLEQADYVSLHMPLTPATRHLIGPAQLGHMKRSAYLINAAPIRPTPTSPSVRPGGGRAGADQGAPGQPDRGRRARCVRARAARAGLAAAGARHRHAHAALRLVLRGGLP
jgi:D-3-phosphoglycerate dehydrogenase / 2-oxoglutarate reductase